VSERDPANPQTDDLEVDEADAIEQNTDAVESDGDEETPVSEDEERNEADPADVAEQSRVVNVDDDEYR
jgi:hypothetical protein